MGSSRNVVPRGGAKTLSRLLGATWFHADARRRGDCWGTALSAGLARLVSPAASGRRRAGSREQRGQRCHSERGAAGPVTASFRARGRRPGDCVIPSEGPQARSRGIVRRSQTPFAGPATARFLDSLRSLGMTGRPTLARNDTPFSSRQFPAPPPTFAPPRGITLREEPIRAAPRGNHVAVGAYPGEWHEARLSAVARIRLRPDLRPCHSPSPTPRACFDSRSPP
jgi:hypothetical protein